MFATHITFLEVSPRDYSCKGRSSTEKKRQDIPFMFGASVELIHTWWKVFCIWLSLQRDHLSNQCRNQEQQVSFHENTWEKIRIDLLMNVKPIQWQSFFFFNTTNFKKSHLIVSSAIWMFWLLSSSGSLENSTRQASCFFTSSLICAS